MNDTPRSLNDICVDCICDNLFASCKTQTSVEGQDCRVLSTNDEFYLPSDVAEKLVDALSVRGKIEDWMLMLFDSKVAVLENVRLRNSSKLTQNGLNTLRSHKISHLEVMGLTHVSVNDLIGCLGDWTLQNLHTLNVANSTFVDKEGCYDVSCLSKLQNLHSLNVRNTEFNDKGLEIVVDNLPNLINLDISETTVCNITSLKKCKDQLQSLTMYNVLTSCGVEMIDVICDLNLLQHLDISCSCQISMQFGPRISDFLRKPSCLPSLTSLDIAGIEHISIDDLRYFLVQHPNMHFLGLATGELCSNEMFTNSEHHLYNPDLVVAGCASEIQTLEVLRRYPHRVILCRKAMYDIHQVTDDCDGLRLDIISLILRGMKTNPKDLIIQSNATNCLENFFDGKIYDEVSRYWLKQIVESVITAMENFPNDEVLQETCLSFLEKDGVFMRVNVCLDKYRNHCVRLLMNTLCTFDEDNVIERSVYFCAFAIQWMSTEEKTLIGANPLYVKKLLYIIQNYVEGNYYDYYLMEHTLDVIYNLSDNIVETCRVLINEDGLYVLMELLEKFGNNAYNAYNAHNAYYATRVFEVMLNIAEFKKIRGSLMTQNILTIIRSCLTSSNIDVSYCSAGITAFLASDGERDWTVTSVSRAEMLKKLGTAVISWQAPVYEIIEYKTFKRLYPLFLCYEMKEVQLWAVWTVRQSCKLNTKVFSDEGGVEKLEEMMSHPKISEDVREICRQILDIVKD